MKELFGGRVNGVQYTVLVDGRFTLIWAFMVSNASVVHDEVTSELSYAFGQAFCSHEDTFDLEIGIDVALERLFRNTHHTKTQQCLVRDALCKGYSHWSADNGCL